MVALNWQTRDRGMQVGELMFGDTKGWLPKLGSLRQEPGARGKRQNTKIIFEIVGISSRQFTP